MLAVTSARHQNDFKIYLAFNNGYEGEVDMREVIYKDTRKIFQPLRDPKYFTNFSVAHDTLCWPNELDFAPEFLFFQAFKDNPKWREQFVAWGYVEAG